MDLDSIYRQDEFAPPEINISLIEYLLNVSFQKIAVSFYIPVSPFNAQYF